MPKYEFNAEYDVVVVGGGAAGKMAAYTAAKEGGLSVALLEKMPATGGTSVYTEDLAAFNSVEQQERKTPPKFTGTPFDHYPTYAEGYARYMDVSHHRANADVVRMQVLETAETIQLYRDLGANCVNVFVFAFNQPNELNTAHRYEGLGEEMQELLLKATVNAGVDIFTATPVKKLLANGGAIEGVEAEDADGNKMLIGAKAVILATGGFGNNPALVKKYAWQHWSAPYTYQVVPTENVGDGLTMALEVGADGTTAPGAVMNIPICWGKTLESHTTGAGIQPVIWVNVRGERFANEEMGFSFMNAGSSIIKQPKSTAYAILDSDQVKFYMEEGSEISLGEFIVFHQKLDLLQTELEQDVAAGTAWKGNTIEELANAISDVDHGALIKTLHEYQEFCRQGEDTRHFKQAQYLRPLTKPPFYAIRMSSSILATIGGIRVNGDMQVTDQSYTPIPGLYATGNDASGLYGDSYNLDCPGTANGFADASGRKAARHAIKVIGASQQ
ncbi:MAG: FAD-dependent oxidoreductase [Micrococcales bacterium]|nr:FAD-dependent oxidoreductase [Micrococcales bacterium]